MTKSATAAVRAIDTIRGAIVSLREFPFRTPQRPGTNQRQLVVPFGRDGYVVRYRVSGDEVVISRIFHGLEDR